ncbi:MAG: histidine kinase [Blautia sp.]|nr:histidine kinase [Blautia sp.]
MKKMKDILQSVTIKLLLLMIILVLPLNLIAVIFTNRAVEALMEQAEFNMQKMAELQMRDLGNRMYIGQTYIVGLVESDPNCIAMRKAGASDYAFQSAKLKAYSTIRSALGSQNGSSNGINGYYYYDQTRQDGVICADADGKSELAQELTGFCDNANLTDYPYGWHLYHWREKDYLVFATKDRQYLYGAVIRVEPFLTLTRSLIEYPLEEIVLSEDEALSKDGNLSISATARKITLNIQVKKAEIRKTMPHFQQIFQIISVIYLALIPILYLLLNRLLIRPLSAVNEAHRQVENGQGDYRIQETAGSKEYRELFSSFNRMADNLHRLKIESYETEISRQKMELRNLQLQIRPHFLLNTFNIIFSLAQKKEIAMIQETVIYLSDYFRYIFRSDKDLELFTKELEMIRGYIRTANIRYSGRIQAEYDLDPELEFIRMPPLLIHNFVENAVKYGIQQKEILHIYLEGRYEKGRVEFSIQDDGKGMTEETLERNQAMFAGNYKPASATEHLGLYNSLKRIKYFFGETAEITVDSELGYGTCFTICFPYELEIENESFDRE